MVHSAVKHLFQIVGALALILLLVAGALLWRLDQGPLSLRGLTPYVADALNDPNSPYHLQMEDLYLAWEGGNRALELRATGINLLDQKATTIAMLPEAAFQISPKALLRGEVRLRGVEILHPFLHLHRDNDGAVTLGMTPGPMRTGEAEPSAPETIADPSGKGENDASDVLALLIDALSNRRDGPLSELAVVRVVSAEALISDDRMGVDWSVPTAALELYRRGDGGVGLSAGLEVSISSLAIPPAAPVPDRAGTANSPDLPGIGTTPARQAVATMHMDITGTYQPSDGVLALDVAFAGLRPAQLSSMAESLAPLAALDLPLNGKIGVTLSVKDTLLLSGIALHLEGGAGVIALPALGGHYQVAELAIAANAQALPGSSLFAAADGQALDKAVIERVSLTLQPPPAADGSQTKTPSVITLSGALTRSSNPLTPLTATLDATVAEVPVNALKEWWPQTVGVNPRTWVVDHLRNGIVDSGSWHVTLSGSSPETLEPQQLKGGLRVHGITVDYLPPLPAVSEGVADVAFALDRLDVTVHQGVVRQNGQDDLQVNSGTVTILGLDLVDQETEIAVGVSGSLPAALTLIDSQPLGYTSKLGLKPTQASGQAEVTLHMAFPLFADLLLEQIEVKAEAAVSDVVLRKAVFGQDLAQGNLTLTVSTTELNAKGKALVAGIPASFNWREVFSGSPYSSRYLVKAQVAEDKRHVFGLTFPPFTPSIIGGPVQADLDLTLYPRGRTTIKAEVDLTPASIKIPGFAWSKTVGTPAHASVDVELKNGDVTAVPRFEVTTEGNLALTGSVALSNKGDLQQITLSKAQIGLSAFQGTMTRQDNGYLIDAKGGTFDLVPFLGKSRTNTAPSGDKTAAAPPPSEAAKAEDAEDLPPLTLRGAFDKVWISDTGALRSVRGQARRVNGRWIWAEMNGSVGDGASVSYNLGTIGSGDTPPETRPFTLRSADAGALLKALGWLGSIDGGVLRSEGSVDRQGTAKGIMSIGPYRLVEAPLLARILSVAALTGILDSLSGEGIGFDGLYAPFVLSDHALSVTDFRSSGSALGLTAEGHIDLDKMTFDLAGTIVPAYAVNGLFGEIPLIGGLLSGFTEGGGLIAATYSLKGPTSDPQISVNPLSAFAPGFLRTLFGMGQPDQTVTTEPPTATPKPQAKPTQPSIGETGPGQ